ncbi:hypothetical protein GP475_00520 [Corynebacterium poyangense]|uniref:Uncharacterized protein n=1 Tax=Corynebacterium poyangense TaxID=2684405 RepID=A0A7H0SL56_9CORY|nr:hypothetical protein [Corynebacterium poyangense]MBZ8177367.1 hypothetical protein [Corynebacterium poyangense]QNQ89281.1 hypothetical protein GP475_00520 [Corynebacterium poyangense]
MPEPQKPRPNAKTLRRYSLLAFGVALFWIALMMGLGHTLQESLGNPLTMSALSTVLFTFIASTTRERGER